MASGALSVGDAGLLACIHLFCAVAERPHSLPGGVGWPMRHTLKQNKGVYTEPEQGKIVLHKVVSPAQAVRAP